MSNNSENISKAVKRKKAQYAAAKNAVDEAQKAYDTCNEEYDALEKMAEPGESELAEMNKKYRDKKEKIEKLMKDLEKHIFQKYVNPYTGKIEYTWSNPISKNQYEKLKTELSELEKKRVEKWEEIAKRMEDIYKQISKKQEECDKLKEKLNNEQEKFNSLGFTLEDLDQTDLLSELSNIETDKNMKYYEITSRDSQLMDLRSLPNGSNFRSNGNSKLNISDPAMNLLKKLTSTGVTHSKTYYMNKDYLFSNSLASPAAIGAIQIKDLPEIQPLILNEFQPYDILSIADMMPTFFDNLVAGIYQGLKNFGLNAIINAAKNSIINNQIDKYSKNPELLYGTSATRWKSIRSEAQLEKENFLHLIQFNKYRICSMEENG